MVSTQAFAVASVLKKHWRHLLLLFIGILLPLYAFGALADEVREGEAMFFDAPLLRWAHTWHGDELDTVFLFFTKIGYIWGVVPLSIALVLVLVGLGKRREGLFAALAMGGSGLLNTAAKHYFVRERPALWTSLAPEHTYSFPSGHAMGSMALAAVVVVIVWRTRWRWPTAFIMTGFVAMVGISRIYLGVHYPSDIIAGWAAALAWTLGTYALLFARTRLKQQ